MFRKIALPLIFSVLALGTGCAQNNLAGSDTQTDTTITAEEFASLAEDATPGEVFFKTKVHRMLFFACMRCHIDKNRLGLNGDPDDDYQTVLDEIAPGQPENSKLYFFVGNPNTKHPGGQIFKEDSEKLRLIREWIELEGQ